MKKKLLTVALAATMVIGSVFSAFAETKTSLDCSTGWAAPGGNSGTESLKGDFDVTYTFKNESVGTENYHNFVLQIIDDTEFINVRADRHAFTSGYVFGFTHPNVDVPAEGEAPSKATIEWTGGPNWDNWKTDMVDAEVKLNVKRTGKTFDVKMDITAASGNTCSMATNIVMDCAVSETIALTLTGEKVKLSNITFKDNKKLSPNGNTGEVTDSPNGNKPELPPAGVVSVDDIKEIAKTATVVGDVPEGTKPVFNVIAKDDKAFAATTTFVEKNFKAAADSGQYAFMDISLVKGEAAVKLTDGGKVNVTFNILKLASFAKVKPNDDVSVYRVSDDGTKVDFIGTSKVAANGELSFETDHFSKYLFVAGAPAKDIDDKDDKDADGKTPTGDTAPIMLLAFAAVVACGTVVFVNKKRAK